MSQETVLLMEVRRLQDRNAVQDVIVTIAAGVDRYDPDLLRGAIWADAEIDMGGPQPITGEAFAAALVPPSVPALGRMHVVGNHRIVLDGDEADCESHVISCQEIGTADGPETRIRAGRYLDHLQRRGDRWKLVRRLFVDEWSRLDAVQARPSLGRHRGAPGPADLAYTEIAVNRESRP